MPAHPALSNSSIKSPSRLLAEAVRDLLDASPSDLNTRGANLTEDEDVHYGYEDFYPVGRLTVERAYLAEMKREDIQDTVVVVLAGGSVSSIGTRSKRRVQIEVEIFIQRPVIGIDNCFHESSEVDEVPRIDSVGGKKELDEFMDFVERIEVALTSESGRKLVDSNGNEHGYLRLERTQLDEESLKKSYAALRIDVEYEAWI